MQLKQRIVAFESFVDELRHEIRLMAKKEKMDPELLTFRAFAGESHIFCFYVFLFQYLYQCDFHSRLMGLLYSHFVYVQLDLQPSSWQHHKSII